MRCCGSQPVRHLGIDNVDEGTNGSRTCPDRFEELPFALETMVDRILPTTDTPGALDVGVPDFIEFVLSEGASAEEGQRVEDGLADLERRAQEAHGVGFTALGPDSADALLRAVELEEFASAPPGGGLPFGPALSKPFFATIKEWTVVGFLTSERGATSLRTFSHMPGRFDGCAAFEPGQKPWMGSF